MARKPMIEPGSLLPSSAASPATESLVDRVIARDREKSGRAIPAGTTATPTPPPNEIDKNITSNTERNITAHITAHKGSKSATQKDAKEAARAVSSADGSAENSEGSSESSPEDAQEGTERSEGTRPAPGTCSRGGAASSGKGASTMAWKTAQQLADTTPLPITLRLAEGLNDYLDEQAHRHRKAKVKKQDLVSLAVRLLVAELESGTDLAELLERGRVSDRI